MTESIHLKYPERFQSFIVFEPASLRVQDSDILIIGPQVQDFFDELMGKVLSRKQTIKEQILHNKLVKVGHMLELLQSYDQVLITRYFDRIWRRHAYISHLGESFLSLNVLYDLFPEYKDKESIVADRYDNSDNDFDEESDNNSDNDEETVSEDEN